MKKSFWFFLFITIIIMVTIFRFSAQTAVESSDTSMNFIRVLLHDRLLEVMSLEEAEKFEVGIETFVRKSAHFFIYMCLGFFSAMTLYCSGKVHKSYILFIIPFVFCMFYASTDEVHQLFVPGRSGEVRDVLIDSSGSLVGIFLSFLIRKLLKKVVKCHS